MFLDLSILSLLFYIYVGSTEREKNPLYLLDSILIFYFKSKNINKMVVL